MAETTEGAFLGAEQVSSAKGSGEEPTVPEDLGRKAAVSLLQEIYRVNLFEFVRSLDISKDNGEKKSVCVFSQKKKYGFDNNNHLSYVFDVGVQGHAFYIEDIF